MKKIQAILLILIFHGAAAADILFFNNGDEINAKVLKIEAGKLFAVVDGADKEYALKDLMKIQLIKEYLPPADYDPLKDPGISSLASAPPNPADYPDGGYLTKLSETVVDVNPDKSYTITTRKIIYVLREKGKEDAGNARIYYFPDFQIPEINYAVNILNGKTDYLNDVSVQTGNEFSSWPEYDLLKSRKFSVPNIKVNSVIEYNYSLKSSYKVLMPLYRTFFFRDFEPADRTVLTVNVPKSLNLAYKELNMPEGYSFKKTESGGKVSYAWETGKLPPYAEENNMPPYVLFAPQVSVALENTWPELASGFKKELEAKIKVSAAMKDLVAGLVRGKTDDGKKAEAVFNWVSASVNLVPVPMNYYSFIPKDSDRTFELKAGNYLDKSFLLYVLLKEAGLDPSFSYLTDKTAVDFKETLPGAAQFQAAQAALNIGGKRLAMVPVDDKHRYDSLPPEYQGAWALEILGQNPGTLYKNPMNEPSREAVIKAEKAEMTAAGDISGHVSMEPRGDEERGWRELKALKKEETDNYFQEYVHGIHPSARLLGYKVNNLEDIGAHLTIDVDYKIPGYAQNVADKYLIFKFPDIKVHSESVGQAKRALPVYFRSKAETARTCEIKLPPGYEVYYLPPRADLSFKGDAYKAGYKAQGDTLVLTEDRVFGETEISPADYPGYKSYIEKIADFTDNWLVLKKK